ncbi:MAG TPA: hypothetical protein VFI34_05130 [Candidatus Limnocylindrales bacterium]|nr:hypothetical protein [Candidatus Limnocylindrales bacterium]
MPDTEYRAVSRPFRPQRGPRLVAIGAALFLAVALVKPWPDPSAGPSADRPSSTTVIAVASVPAAPPSPSAGPNAMPCLAGAETQVVTMERSVGRSVRSWIAVVDEIAGDAADLHQPAITVFSSDLIGIGVCGPETVGAAGRTPGPSGAAARRDPQAASLITVVVSNASGPAGLLDLGLGAPLPGQDAGVDSALLYGPPPAMSGSAAGSAGDLHPPIPQTAPTEPATGGSGGPSDRPGSNPAEPAGREPIWGPGSYAIGFRYRSDSPALVRWFRIEIAPSTTPPG